MLASLLQRHLSLDTVSLLGSLEESFLEFCTTTRPWYYLAGKQDSLGKDLTGGGGQAPRAWNTFQKPSSHSLPC